MNIHKVAVISQPRFIPSLNYIHRMIIADTFVFLDNVQYTPRDWENRNKVKSSNGPIWLSVPVIKISRDQKIKDTIIDYSQNWIGKQLNSLKHNYSKTPYFDEVYNLFETIVMMKKERLMDLNLTFINSICEYLSIKCDFLNASDIVLEVKGQELLIQLCKKINADIYLSGPLGSNYINNEEWDKENIRLTYHEYNYPTYAQIYGAFEPWLSIIDLMFNHGPNSLEIICKGNITKQELINN